MSINNPFLWASHPRPSLFASDKTFLAAKTTGKSHQQTSTDSAMKYEQRTGRSLGSISRISPLGDLLIEEGQARRKGRA